MDRAAEAYRDDSLLLEEAESLLQRLDRIEACLDYVDGGLEEARELQHALEARERRLVYAPSVLGRPRRPAPGSIGQPLPDPSVPESVPDRPPLLQRFVSWWRRVRHDRRLWTWRLRPGH